MDYCFSDILQAYRTAGLQPGQIVHVKSNLATLGIMEDDSEKPILERDVFLKMHYEALRECVTERGTIVMGAATERLMGTTTPFDLENTPGEVGIFAEFLRNRKGVVRSLHPFCSYVAEGPMAERICADVSRNDYGPFTPEGRMCQLGAWDLSLGLEPHTTCSVVHHAEFTMGVPYRYQKEFMHPLKLPSGEIRTEPFYCYLWYRGMYPDCDSLDRGGENRNKHFFREFRQRSHPLKMASLGRSAMWHYPMAEFFETCMEMIQKNPYAYLARPPVHRPYQK